MQRPSESLRSYIKRFTITFANVIGSNEGFAIQTFRACVTNENVHYALCNSYITSMHELILKAQAFVEVKEIRLNHIGRMQLQEQKRNKPSRLARPPHEEKSTPCTETSKHPIIENSKLTHP